MDSSVSSVSVHEGQQDASGKALSVWLQRKGIVLEAQKRFQDALALSDDPKVMEKSQELAHVKGTVIEAHLLRTGKGRGGSLSSEDQGA